MTRDAVDLEPAIAAAREAVKTYLREVEFPAVMNCDTLARVSVHAAAEVLGLIGLPAAQHADPPATSTATVTPRKEYL